MDVSAVAVTTSMFAVDLEARSHLAAGADRAWQALSDTGAYRDWNPFVTRFDGELREGARVDVELSLPGRSPQRMRPRIVEAAPGRSFAWRGSFGPRGIFDGVHRFEIVPLGDNECEFIQSERLSGVLVPVFRGMLTGPTPEAFAAFNSAFAQRVEHG
jgi:hypothetical protein